MDRLQEFLGQALAGQGGVALITGEAGRGKTALLEEWARRAGQAHRDLIVLRGSCSAYGGAGDPYLPFREMLQTLAGDVEGKRAGGALSPEQARRVWEALPTVGAALVQHGPDLIGRFVPGEEVLRRVEGFPGSADVGRWQTQLREIVRRGIDGTPSAFASGMGAPALQPDLFAQVTRVLHATAVSRPLLLQVDDLQWADEGTVALLFHLGRHLAGSRILLACAYRPEALRARQQSQAAAIPPVLRELTRQWGEVLVDLDAADGQAFVDAYVDTRPNRLGRSFRQALFEHTEGNPLFTVELLRRFEHDGTLAQDGEGNWVEAAGPDWERWPPRLEAVIAEHLAGLPDADQALLQTASVQGQQFTAEVAARVLGWREEAVLRRLSSLLSSRHGLIEAVSLERLPSTGQRVSVYRFRHALLQRGAYRSLDVLARARLHEATGWAMEAIYLAPAGRVAGGAAAERQSVVLAPELARHFEAANLPLDAARYRLEAGRWATHLVAYDQAIAHLQCGLALLQAVQPSLERVRLELALWVAIVDPLLLQGGWQSPDYTRAVERLDSLTQHPDLQDDPQRHVALTVLALLTSWSAEPERGQRVGLQLQALAQDGNRESLMLAHWVLGHSYLWRGNLAAARDHLSQALALHDPQAGRLLSPLFDADPRVMGLAVLGHALWLLGYPDQGRDSLGRALAQAQALAQPPSTAFVHLMAGMAHAIYGRNAAVAHNHAAALQSLGQAGGFYSGFSEILAARDGRADAGEPKPELVQGTGAAAGAAPPPQAVGSGVGLPARLLVQARSCALAGQVDAGVRAMDRAQAWIDSTGVRLLQAEVWRMRGELLANNLGSGKADPEVEACFRRALEVAREQQARWLELRAAVSLARLWQAHGRRDEARDLLAGIYGWFTEGFDMADLVEAKALLEGLG